MLIVKIKNGRNNSVTTTHYFRSKSDAKYT